MSRPRGYRSGFKQLQKYGGTPIDADALRLTQPRSHKRRKPGTSPASEARAKKALQRAAWERANPRPRR